MALSPEESLEPAFRSRAPDIPPGGGAKAKTTQPVPGCVFLAFATRGEFHTPDLFAAGHTAGSPYRSFS
jgi:hypothetical protein